MTNTLVNSLSNSKQPQKSLKLLVFPVGKLMLSLPVDEVEKVINLPELYSSGLNSLAVAHGDDGEIVAIDLHKKLFNISAVPDSQEQNAYLVIAQNTMDEKFGIIVTQTPSIIDVPLSDVRVLPQSYRQADTLEIASHVVIFKNDNQSLTIFIIDSDRVL